jgi:hypothetical protein
MRTVRTACISIDNNNCIRICPAEAISLRNADITACQLEPGLTEWSI